MKNEKRSILLCAHPGDYSGVPKYVSFIANELKDQYKFTILTSKNGEIYNNTSCKIFENRHLTNSLSLFGFLRNLIILNKVIKNNNFDVVHLNGTMFGATGRLLALKYRNIKFIYTLHGIPWGEGRGLFFSFLIKIIEKLLILLSPAAVISISKKDLNIIRMLTKKNIQYIPNCVSFEESNFDFLSSKSYEKKTIICVARFEKQKNLSRLISAFANMKIHCSLILIGSGTDSDECINLAKSITNKETFKRIRFIGETNEVDHYLKKASLFCLSSDYEGMPLSALEASFFNIPVIMPDVGGAYEIAKYGSGYIYSPNNHEELCKILEKFINDNESLIELSKNSSNKFKKFFAKEKFLDSMVQLYL